MASGAGAATTAAANGPALPASVSAPPDPMRAYRACLHCRSRKTKCTLDSNGGRPVSVTILFFEISMVQMLASCRQLVISQILPVCSFESNHARTQCERLSYFKLNQFCVHLNLS